MYCALDSIGMIDAGILAAFTEHEEVAAIEMTQQVEVATTVGQE